MNDFTSTSDRDLCVLLREDMVERNHKQQINIYKMGGVWEHAARFICEPYYWRHNIVTELQAAAAVGEVDLAAWPVAQEAIRRWRDTSIVVRCTRSDGTGWNTRFNGTEKDAEAYFMGMCGQELVFGQEVSLPPVVKVEVIHG